jgi:hypothetical protein
VWLSKRFANGDVVARRFLEGLREDFSNLSPAGPDYCGAVSGNQPRAGNERLMLSLKFQFLYALVWLRLSTGNLPLPQLESLDRD